MTRRFLTALLLCAPAAFANPFELYGFTPRAMGMGGAMTAIGDDLGASFYNPGALLGHTKTEFGIGFADTHSNLYVDRSSASPTISTATVENTPRFELGLIFPLGGALLKDRVVLAIGGGHPLGGLIRVQTVDESHPQFYMYQSKAQRFALNGALGVKIVDGLSVGVGVQITAEQIGKVDFALDVASKQFKARDITVDLNTIPTPTAGILIQPSESLSIGFSWRKESQLYYAQPTGIDLGDLGALNLGVQGLAQYWPHVFSGAVSFKLTEKVLVTAQADYLLWSRAPNDQVQVSVTPSGPVLTSLGLDKVLAFQSADASMGFANILVPHLAVEYAGWDWLTLRAGGYVRPAITPDQNGTTNYLDNFTECVGAGASFRFTDPLQVFTEPVTFDIGGQLIIANQRSSQKQAADPTGSMDYGGSLVSFAAMLRYLY
ncbi:MAG TPA: outer membrane protein transport protein [Myxococcales bacterium]|nr:outer membrane protein transport protein [Myxococcales bacterium]